MSSETLFQSSPFLYVCACHIRIYTNANTHVHMCILVSEAKTVVSVFWETFRKQVALSHMYARILYKYIQMHTHVFLSMKKKVS